MLCNNAFEISHPLNNLLNFAGDQAISLIEIVTTFADLAFLLQVPDVTAIYLNIVSDASITVEGVPLIASYAYSVVSKSLTVASGIHTF